MRMVRAGVAAALPPRVVAALGRPPPAFRPAPCLHAVHASVHGHGFLGRAAVWCPNPGRGFGGVCAGAAGPGGPSQGVRADLSHPGSWLIAAAGWGTDAQSGMCWGTACPVVAPRAGARPPWPVDDLARFGAPERLGLGRRPSAQGCSGGARSFPPRVGGCPVLARLRPFPPGHAPASTARSPRLRPTGLLPSPFRVAGCAGGRAAPGNRGRRGAALWSTCYHRCRACRVAPAAGDGWHGAAARRFRGRGAGAVFGGLRRLMFAEPLHGADSEERARTRSRGG